MELRVGCFTSPEVVKSLADVHDGSVLAVPADFVGPIRSFLGPAGYQLESRRSLLGETLVESIVHRFSLCECPIVRITGGPSCLVQLDLLLPCWVDAYLVGSVHGGSVM